MLVCERNAGFDFADCLDDKLGGALLVAAQRLDWPLEEGWFGHIAATAKGGDRASK